MQSLTYTNKTPLYINSDIPDANKGNASDFNDIKSVVNVNATECGNASDLTTTNKTSLVVGINEVNSKSGNLSSLKTSSTADLVSAINELYDSQFYQVGDTINFTYIILSGLITNASKDLVFSLFLPKSLANITQISITSFNAELRGTLDYLNNSAGFTQYVGLSGYTLTPTKSSNNSINITLAKSTAYTNVNNNTPVVARVTLSINLN